MSLPGFTADVSLDRTKELYHATQSSNQHARGIYPAQILAIPSREIPVDFFTRFSELQCWRICLGSWGGYCRWICF